MYNYKLTIQYDGTRYRGWQVQGNTDQTIQGKVEGVLSRLTGQPVELHGSGRTDAGVHALGQVANVKLPRPFDPSELLRELNRYLPADIGVIAVEPAPERFHAGSTPTPKPTATASGTAKSPTCWSAATSTPSQSRWMWLLWSGRRRIWWAPTISAASVA